MSKSPLYVEDIITRTQKHLLPPAHDPKRMNNLKLTSDKAERALKDSKGGRNTVSLTSLNELTHLIVAISSSFLRSMHLPFRSRFPTRISLYNSNSSRVTFSIIALPQCTETRGSRI